ncbi:MAG TPA: PQQ-binding-like beta-propeller repeat protein, partial [Vicinamibacterales bacterium]|nr:PQQ-binding-like beta-propeller repeat protein [Vicinamibacterales bacterium]
MRGVKARAAVALCGAVLGIAVASADDEWPRFRGSNGGVAADHPSLPDQWGPAQNIVWKIDVPGRSWSSPVVWGDHVFVTTAINTLETESLLPVASYVSRSNGGTMTFMDVSTPSAPHRWVLYDVDLKTGRIRWERVAHTGVPSKSRHLKNSYAAETPVTDGERVYVYFGDVGLFAYDMDGKLLWSRPMDALEMQTGFGHAASPVVDDSRVYIVNDNEEQSFIAAYDKRTGVQVWRVDRKEASNWTTPLVWKNDLRTEIITAATGGVRSYDVNGKLLWQFTGMSTFAVPIPLASGGLLYVMSGYTASALRPAYAIRAGATGDISLKPDQTSNEYIVWADRTLGTFHPSPLVYRGCYYMLHDRG